MTGSELDVCYVVINRVTHFLLCRMTLLLGPPGSGKSSLLMALAGKLDSNLKVHTVLLLRVLLNRIVVHYHLMSNYKHPELFYTSLEY